MKHKKHAITVPLICLLTALVAPLDAPAQEQTPDENRERPSAAEMVTDYLKQDIFLRPGVGLKSVKVGMPFEQVLQTWGAPGDEGRGTLLGNKWTYAVGDHTTITLIGDDDVDVIRVIGGFNSPYVTAEGASFGMAQHQLATIYGPAEQTGNRVMFEQRGIGFVMERGQVAEIRVFQPKN